jgi:hypothetical protein
MGTFVIVVQGFVAIKQYYENKPVIIRDSLTQWTVLGSFVQHLDHLDSVGEQARVKAIVARDLGLHTPYPVAS